MRLELMLLFSLNLNKLDNRVFVAERNF
jgi:hypothetical protein